MKRLITILLFALGVIGLAVKTKRTTSKYFTGPVKPYSFSPAEYNHALLDAAGTGYEVNGIPTSLIGWPTNMVAFAAGTHGLIGATSTQITTAADNNSTGWQGNGTTGSGGYGPTTVTTDSLGNPFSNIIMVGSGGTLLSPSGWNFWMVEQGAVTDTLFMVGATDGGIHFPGPASGFNTKWVKVAWVTGKHIKKVQLDVIAIMLMTDGTAYDWGGSSFGASVQYILGQGSSPVTNTPTLIPAPGGGHTWKDIAGGSFWNYLLRDDGKLYGMAYYAGYLGVGANNQLYNQPNAISTLWQLDTALNFPAPVAQIAATMTGSYALLTNGTFWAWGDNACGTFGIGTELNFATYPNGTGTMPWDWDQGLGELFSHKPVQVAAGKSNFVKIWYTNELAPYIVVTDANGDAFSAGRNKGGIQGDGSVGAGSSGTIPAIYPNGNDNYYLKKITPFATSTVPVTSPYCKLNPATVPCNNYTIPVNGAPNTVYTVRYAIINGVGAIISDLSLSTDLSGHFIHLLHRQVSGPSLQMGVQDQPIDTIYGAAPGQTYTFRGTAQNPTFDSTAVVVSFIVPNPSTLINLPNGAKIKWQSH